MSVVGGELAMPDRIKYIQGQMRIAVQNHQVLWQRLIFKPNDTEVENMLRMLQAIILSLGRRQTELMNLYKRDLRLKYPGDEEMQKKVSMNQLGWPDRDDPVRKHLANGSTTDVGKKQTPQLVRKTSNMQLGRPGQKMTSLLKPPVGNANQQSTQLQRKESERLKAAAAKLAESNAPVITKRLAPGQKPKIVLKVDPASRRRSNEKLSDSDNFPELKESELAGYKLTPQDKATELAELSQDQYLECFGLVHRDKSKSMVVRKTKRKRRTAAGQSDFYKDFFQPKRPYNRKTQMADAESPTSSQEITEVDSTEFSPPSQKPSVPPSPASSCSTDLLEGSTPREGSPTVLEASEGVGESGGRSEEIAKMSEDVGETGSQSEEVAETVESVNALEESLLVEEVDETIKEGDFAEKSLVLAPEKPALGSEESLVAAETPALVAEESLVMAAENPVLLTEESLVMAAEESLIASAEKPMLLAEESLVMAAEESLIAANENSALVAEESLVMSAEESLITASEKPVLVAEESLVMAAEESLITAAEKPVLGAEESLVMAAENSVLVAEESLAMADEESLITAAEKPVLVAEESLVMAAEESLVMAAEESLVMAAEESLVMAAEEFLISSAEKPVLAADQLLITAAEKTVIATDEPLVEEASAPTEVTLPAVEEPPNALGKPLSEELPSVSESSSNENSLLTSETPDPACKETSLETEPPCAVPQMDTIIEDSNSKEPPKTDDGQDSPCKTPPNDSTPPSPTNEDDDDDDDESSFSPSDLIETETYNIPSTISLPSESVSSVGEESNGEPGVDISAMIGENVQYFSADGTDCSEMVNRYRLEGNPEESEDEEDYTSLSEEEIDSAR